MKELVQLRRDWMMTAFIFTLPLLQLILLAQATSSRISNLCVAVLDSDRSSASRRLVTALDNRRELDICYHPATLEETHQLLDQGEATFVVIIPAGFAAGLADVSRAPSVQIIADGSNDILGGIALSAARGAIATLAAPPQSPPTLGGKTPPLVLPPTLGGKTPPLGPPQFWGGRAPLPQSWGRGRGWGPTIDLRPTVRFNPTFDFRFFSVPAQVGFIIYQVTLTVASIGLARERELGTLEQLMVMPLRRIELVIGKAIPALIVGTVNFLLMLAVAVFGFHVPLRGSLALLFGLTVLFIVTEIGYGIFISSIARTQQQANLFVFVLAMVDMAFSGYMVRVKNLPAAFQLISQVVPFRHYLAIIRGIMVKGAGLDVLWPHAAAMLLMGLFITAVAVRNLNKSLD